MLSGLSSVATIFMMIGMGYFLAYRKLFNGETNKLLSKLVLQVSLPLMIISSLPKRFTLEELMGSSRGAFVAFASILLSYAIAYILSYLLKVEERERGLFCVLFSLCNSIFIGLPFNISLYGEGSTPFVFLYYIANTLVFWSIGVYNIKKHSALSQEGDGILNTLKKVFSPPLIGFFVGVLLIALKIQLPEFLDTAFVYIGQLSTPLSMFFIGTVIYQMDFKELRLDRITVAILVGKFLISPLIVMGLLLFFDLPELLEKVFVIQGAGPIIAQVALVAEYYEVNAKYSAFMVGLSTILYMFIIPIYVLILG